MGCAGTRWAAASLTQVKDRGAQRFVSGEWDRLCTIVQTAFQVTFRNWATSTAVRTSSAIEIGSFSKAW